MKLPVPTTRFSASAGGAKMLERVAARGLSDEARVVPQSLRPSIQPHFLGSLLPIPGGSSLCKLACRAIPNATARRICEMAC